MQQASAVALGLFDGVHIGHRAVLAAAVACKAEGLVPSAFTMQTTSVQLKRGEPLQFLYSDTIKQRLLVESGIQQVVCPMFADIASMDGETFCRTYLQEKMHAKKLFCGKDFRFGKYAAWGVADLQQFGRQMGFTVEVVEAVQQSGDVISSSRIRKMLADGKVEQAADLLGAPYQLEGVIQHGAALGRTLQFPTINLPFAAGQLVPLHGVYRTKVFLKDGSHWDGVTNIGVKPTVSEEQIPIAETHLLGYHGDLYGQPCRIEVLEFLRREQKFASLEQLKAAIANDMEIVRQAAGCH
ncbi:MAG: riboflavin biosynthesis protein RibF [Oscillospiraceae bacterium]|nr:riboflavin biosynthesis protein RibF [Oscillospiraceae bacterium]